MSDTEFAPNFGTLNAPEPERRPDGKGRKRLAILGDFSGRATRGELEIGDGLANRKPLKLDVDTMEQLLQRLEVKVQLPIGADDSVIEVEISEIESFHPDELYEELELFSELAGLRQQLKNSSTFDRAAATVRGWAEEAGEKPKRKKKPKAAAVAVGARLSDFEKLMGQRVTASHEEADIDSLLANIVGPHIVAAPDPEQSTMIAAVDAALSDAMLRVLHHPDFQTVEAAWRSADLLTRRVETDAELQLVMYDVSVEEFTADLAAQDELSESGLYKMLVENPALDEDQGPLSAIFGLYEFDETPPHAELLSRIGKIAQQAHAPFVASMSANALKTDWDDHHVLIRDTWKALKKSPEAAYIGLASPRFLLRHPYGAKSEPVDPFDFEEFSRREGVKGMLWANPAVLACVMLAKTLKEGKRLGQIMTMGDVPYHVMEDEYGDQIALPTTERLLNAKTAQKLAKRGYMPVLSIKGRNEVRLGSFQSLKGKPIAGFWSGAPIPIEAEEPEVEVMMVAGKAPERVKVEEEEEDVTPGFEDDDDDLDLDLDLDFDLDDDSEAEESDGDDDLDLDLDFDLDDLGGDDDAGDDDDGMDELDALLADLGGDDDEDDEDEDLDADLDALLADL